MRPINYAHRGASAYYPENTMEAFFAGLRMGADGIETDVHRTRDGVLVLFHDDTLDRVTDSSGRIEERTYAEIEKTQVFSRDRARAGRIPTLQEFCEAFSAQDLSFAVELKQAACEEAVIDLLDAYGMREKTVLTSFDFDTLARAKAYAPGYRIGYLYGGDADAMEKMREIGGEQLCPEAKDLTPEFVAAAHRAGFSVRAWGVRDEALMRHVCACGADGMTVNFPDKLTEYLNTL